MQTDTDKLQVLDHVNARVLERTDKGVLLEIENPTDYPAEVSIFAETQAEAQKPLGWNAYADWQKVSMKEREKVKILLSPDNM